MEITLQDLKSLVHGDTSDDGGFGIGEKVFIRTVTHYYVGLVEAVTATTVMLSNASWVADTGRFNGMLTTGEINELEPFVFPVHVARGAIVDHTSWPHDLPREQK